VMGVLANQGRDKVTFITSPTLRPYADWAEQLIAESTGKQGKGIVPVAGEGIGKPKVYGSDRLFAYLHLDGEDDLDDEVEALIKVGQPVVRYDLRDRYDLAGQMFLWEMATAVAGYHLHINPFNQPNVEAAKKAARKMIAAYTETGKLPGVEASITDGTMRVIGSTRAHTPRAALRNFLDQGQPGDYVALQAYIQMNSDNEAVLRDMQQRIRDETGLATTLGFGPRFLHSTGQLHKGGANTGLFVQIVSQNPADVAIPDEPGSDASAMPFDVLKNAQVLGDREALLEAGRRVITFDIGNDVAGNLKRLSNAVR
jgi:transaldolase/glucose-6-phosphate isomerase